MFSAIYQLKSTRRFEETFKDIDTSKDVIVRPTHLSICHADQRYYQGKRPANVLRDKLPMALIHEGIGYVVKDNTNTFKVGQKVVMIPNQPVEHDDVIKENYLRTSKFCASTTDGFMQEYISFHPDRLVLLPDNINPLVAAFTELVSVSFHALDRFDQTAHQRRSSIAFWGDGNLSYITALLTRYMYPDAKIYIMGLHNSKLADFTFADATFLVDQIPHDLKFDHAFECVGGAGSSSAINQIIDYINPEGTIAILGVSEDLVPLNTRMILEKGLRILGSSRSGREDYTKLVQFYVENPEIIDYLENIIGNEVEVKNVNDITKAFEADITKVMGKTIMVWKG